MTFKLTADTIGKCVRREDGVKGFVYAEITRTKFYVVFIGHGSARYNADGIHEYGVLPPIIGLWEDDDRWGEWEGTAIAPEQPFELRIAFIEDKPMQFDWDGKSLRVRRLKRRRASFTAEVGPDGQPIDGTWEAVE